LTPEEELFNELLSRLKSSIPYPPAPVTETPADHLTHLDIAIWIMESKEIFHEGRLKGSKKTTAGKTQYNSYPIKDLEILVTESALDLFSWLSYTKYKYTDRERLIELFSGLFDQLLQSYDAMANEISFMTQFDGTIIKEAAISDTRKVIDGRRRRVLKNIKPWFGEDDIKKDLANLFITHVPEAPPL
jgi:hypothetical protein